MHYSVAEFFAGIGLVRLGLGKRWKCQYANDFDPNKQVMYTANFSDEIDPRDIREVHASDIPSCDLWTASFPCNNTSIAGSYSGIKGKSSSMIHEFLRIVDEAGEDAPHQILLENVLGFAMRDQGADLRYVLVALNELGYGVDVIVLDAKWWVPQSRRRLFVIAQRQLDEAYSLLPEESMIRPSLVTQFMQANADLAWAHIDSSDVRDSRPQLASIIEELPPDDPRWWDAERSNYLYSQFSDRHRLLADTMMQAPNVSYATIFRRVRKGRSMAELRTDGIAGCLRTPRGGSGRQILFQAGKGHFHVRLLTPRECARLQGVPDSYRITVNNNPALFGFGDAVCVPAIRWISDNCLIPRADSASVSRGFKHV